MLIGYARVSTQDQNLDLQQDALKNAGCSKIFTDKISGAKVERDGLAGALEFLREGDSLVVWKLDRLGRSLRDLINIVQDLERREISFVCTSQNIDTRTPSGKLFFHIFGALAEYEREIIRERTKAGLNAARSRGRLGGRKKALTDEEVEQIKAMMANKNIPIKSILRTFEIGKTTLYKYLKADSATNDSKSVANAATKKLE